MTTTAAPYFMIALALLIKSDSPSFKLILLTMHLPCKHLRPLKITSKLLESTIIGALDMSGSGIIKLQNFVIAPIPSIIPSSMFMSTMSAPLSIWTRAIPRASS
eukprot:NODE_142_length_17801_cov_0.377020.p10 type:complete len:104 gc:universal NODE_142_length_17801_cov_0.377020:15628-15939(+)